MYACKQKTCKDTGRKWPSVDQEDSSEETKFVKNFISNFQPLELWRNKFLSLGSPLACKEIKPVNPEYWWGGMRLSWSTYFGHLLWRADSLGKTMMLGKIEGNRRRRAAESWIAAPTPWTWAWVNSRKPWGAGRPGALQSMGLQRVGQDWATQQQQHFCHVNYLFNWQNS